MNENKFCWIIYKLRIQYFPLNLLFTNIKKLFFVICLHLQIYKDNIQNRKWNSMLIAIWYQAKIFSTIMTIWIIFLYWTELWKFVLFETISSSYFDTKYKKKPTIEFTDLRFTRKEEETLNNEANNLSPSWFIWLWGMIRKSLVHRGRSS